MSNFDNLACRSVKQPSMANREYEGGVSQGSTQWIPDTKDRNPYSGTPLYVSDMLSDRIRESFGIDTGEISLRESPEVSRLGARATAQGNAVRFAPGEFQPNTYIGLKMLGHELAHVREQVGSVRAPAGSVLRDAGHEARSDAAGAAFASGEMSGATVVNLGGLSARGAPVQMWGKAVHYEDTLKWAQEDHLFTKKEAEKIAGGDQYVDDDPETKPDKVDNKAAVGVGLFGGGLFGGYIGSQYLKYATDEALSWHFDMSYRLGGSETRIKHFVEQFAKAENLLASNLYASLFEFGRGLHPLQDIHAHQDWKPREKDDRPNSMPDAHITADEYRVKTIVRGAVDMDPASKFDDPNYDLKKNDNPNKFKAYEAIKADRPEGNDRYQKTEQETKNALRKFHNFLHPQTPILPPPSPILSPPSPILPSTEIKEDPHNPKKTLSRGQRGKEVSELQSELKKQGYTLEVDGIFGSKTETAVRHFQKENKLRKVDGIVGPETWGALLELNKKQQQQDLKVFFQEKKDEISRTKQPGTMISLHR